MVERTSSWGRTEIPSVAWGIFLVCGKSQIRCMRLISMNKDQYHVDGNMDINARNIHLGHVPSSVAVVQPERPRYCPLLARGHAC